MPTDRSAVLDPRYEVIDPSLSPDQWDDSEPSNIHELGRQLNQQSSKELDKVAIRQSRFRVLPRILALFVPVAASFAILQLSWRQLYWRDSDGRPRSISEDLAKLQIAAKTQEVLIGLSLSDIVLHHLRQQLSSENGLPFGLFTSAYQVALGTQPFSFGFFYSVKSSFWRRDIRWQPLILALFLLLSTLLGLAAGPASAVALIPRLDWWPDNDMFFLYTSPRDYNREHPSPFTMYIPKPLFPSVVDASSLPGSYCLHAELDVNGSCPYAGFQDVLPQLNFTGGSENITINTPLPRPMATRYVFSGDSGNGSFSTWTTSHVLANYMSLAFEESRSSSSFNPSIIEAITQMDSVFTPTVGVRCVEQPSTVYNRNLSELAGFNGLKGTTMDELVPPSGLFDIRTVWNESILTRSNNTLISFEDDLPNGTIPGLLALIYAPGREGTANVTMCNIIAAWEPSKLWVLKSGGYGPISSNFTWDLYNSRENDDYNNGVRAERPLKLAPLMTIRKDWADALNPISNTTSKPLLAELLQDGANQAVQQFEKTSKEGGVEFLMSVHSSLLSRVVADGLARIGAEYSVNPRTPDQRNVTICRNRWCSSGPYLSPLSKPKICNGTKSEWFNYFATEFRYGYREPDNQLLHSYPEPKDIATSWTRVAFPVKRYGYAWSLEPTTVKIATVVLMLHTLIIIIHCCYLILTGRCYSFASSLGDLVALALNSQQPAAFKSASVGIGKSTSWSRPISVRESQGHEKDAVDRLEMVADEHGVKSVEDASLHRRLVAGKRYQ